MQFQDVTSRASEAEFLKLFALAVGHPTPDKLADIVKAYDSSTRRLFALVTEEGVMGVVGIELPIEGRSRIRHIAVPARHRGRGFGRRLLTEVSAAVGATTLVAHTDTDAVGFYQSCGFAVSSLGEMYPGVERFECTLNTVY